MIYRHHYSWAKEEIVADPWELEPEGSLRSPEVESLIRNPCTQAKWESIVQTKSLISKHVFNVFQWGENIVIFNLIVFEDQPQQG